MNHAFMYVEKKSKHTDLNNTPELMSLPINDLSYFTLIEDRKFQP